MAEKTIGELTLRIDPEALRDIVAQGRLMELAATLANKAAAQISAQVVEHVAQLALKPEALNQGVNATVSFIQDEGDPGFGTRPPRPRFVVGANPGIVESALTRTIPGQEAGQAD